MKRILIGWMAALSALLCACSAQTVWETVDGGCVPAEGGAAYAIRIALPQDAVEEVFAERGLLSIERKDTTLTLRLTADGKKVELDKSPYLSALHGFLL